MIQNQELTKGMKVIYIGSSFEGYSREQPYMTFLGYSHGWSTIWADYQGTIKYLSVNDIAVIEQDETED